MVMQMEARGQEAREGAEERRTAAEYLAGADSRGSELIDGKLYGMGAPDLMHAQMVLLIGEQLRACVKEDSRRGLVLPVPVGVGFREDAYTLLLPDITVTVEPGGYTAYGLMTSPDLIVEVLTEETAEKDRYIKLARYMRGGVREYWIVDPRSSTVMVYERGAAVIPMTYTFDDAVPVGIWNREACVDFRAVREAFSMQ